MSLKNKIYFLPIVKYVINTEESSNEIITRISRITEVVTKFSSGGQTKTSKPYEGFLTENKFQLKKVLKIGYSSFLPVAYGNIKELREGKGSVVNIKIQFSNSVNIFLIAFLIFSTFWFMSNLDYGTDKDMIEIYDLLNNSDINYQTKNENLLSSFFYYFRFSFVLYLIMIVSFNYWFRSYKFDLEKNIGNDLVKKS